MKLRALKIAALALASIAGATAISAGPAAAAVTATFNFNNMGTGSNPSSQGTQSSTIATYMTGILSGYYAGATVTVNGAIGQQGSGAYAGEGFVVGPKSSGTVTSYTLANTNGGSYETSSSARANDGFIKNCTGGECTGGTSSSYISLNFNGHSISSFSFDFEIFPDGTCAADTKSACGGNKDADGHRPNLPDLEIYSTVNTTTGEGTGTHFDTIYGVDPGTGGTYQYSPNNKTSSDPETAPQLLGHVSYTVSDFATSGPITSLVFIDWPETIAIDNLKVTFIPEASTLAFLAFGVLGLAWMTRRKHVGWAQLFRSPKRA